MNNRLPRKVTSRGTKGLVRGTGLWYTIARSIFRPILQEIEIMSAETQAAIDEMRADIEANTSVTTSVVALIQSLSQQIADAADDPEEIRALAAQLKSSTDALAAAVPANTPAAGGSGDTPEAPVSGEGTDSSDEDEDGE